MQGDDPDPRARAAALAARLPTFTRDRAEECRAIDAHTLARGERRIPIPAALLQHLTPYPGDRVLAWFEDDRLERVQLVERAAADVASTATAELLARFLQPDTHPPPPAEQAYRERLAAELAARPDALAALEAAIPGPRDPNPAAERRRLEMRLGKATELLGRLAPAERLAFALRQLARDEPDLEKAMVEVVCAHAATDPGVIRHLLVRPERKQSIHRGLATLPEGELPADLGPLVRGLCQHPSAGVRFAAIGALGRAASSPDPLLALLEQTRGEDREWVIDQLRRFPEAYLGVLRAALEQGWDRGDPRLTARICASLGPLFVDDLPDLERAFARGEGEAVWDGPAAVLAWMRRLRGDPGPAPGPARLAARAALRPGLEEIRVEGGGELGASPLYVRAGASSFVIDDGRMTLRRAEPAALLAGERALLHLESGGYPYYAPPRALPGRLLDASTPLAPLLPGAGERTCLRAGVYLVASFALRVARVEASEVPPWARNLPGGDDADRDDQEPLGLTGHFGPPFTDERGCPARLALLPGHRDPALAPDAGEVLAYGLAQLDREADPPETRVLGVVIEGARTLDEAARAGAEVRARLVIPIACPADRARWAALAERLAGLAKRREDG